VPFVSKNIAFCFDRCTCSSLTSKALGYHRTETTPIIIYGSCQCKRSTYLVASSSTRVVIAVDKCPDLRFLCMNMAKKVRIPWLCLLCKLAPFLFYWRMGKRIQKFVYRVHGMLVCLNSDEPCIRDAQVRNMQNTQLPTGIVAILPSILTFLHFSLPSSLALLSFPASTPFQFSISSLRSPRPTSPSTCRHDRL
jgi:hypothetical protein